MIDRSSPTRRASLGALFVAGAALCATLAAPARAGDVPPPTPTPDGGVETICDDGEDNDGDTVFDCADHDCHDAPNCQADGRDEVTDARCSDWVDNDTDGFTDCDDADCYGPGVKACQGSWDVEKAQTDARKHLVRVPLRGTTIPHAITARYRSSYVKLIPAAPGTGIIAGAAVRAVLEAAGVHDVLTKALGSKNPMNLAKATFEGLLSMRTRREVEERRGVKIG